MTFGRSSVWRNISRNAVARVVIRPAVGVKVLPGIEQVCSGGEPGLMVILPHLNRSQKCGRSLGCHQVMRRAVLGLLLGQILGQGDFVQGLADSLGQSCFLARLSGALSRGEVTICGRGVLTRSVFLRRRRRRNEARPLMSLNQETNDECRQIMQREIVFCWQGSDREI